MKPKTKRVMKAEKAKMLKDLADKDNKKNYELMLKEQIKLKKMMWVHLWREMKDLENQLKSEDIYLKDEQNVDNLARTWLLQNRCETHYKEVIAAARAWLLGSGVSEKDLKDLKKYALSGDYEYIIK